MENSSVSDGLTCLFLFYKLYGNSTLITCSFWHSMELTLDCWIGFLPDFFNSKTSHHKYMQPSSKCTQLKMKIIFQSLFIQSLQWWGFFNISPNGLILVSNCTSCQYLRFTTSIYSMNKINPLQSTQYIYPLECALVKKDVGGIKGEVYTLLLGEYRLGGGWKVL